MFFEYEVLFYDNANNEEVADFGLLFAQNYAEAAQKIEDTYADDLINLKIHPHEICELFSLKGLLQEEFYLFKKEDIFSAKQDN